MASSDLAAAINNVKIKFNDAFTYYADHVATDMERAFAEKYRGSIDKMFSNSEGAPDAVAKEIRTLMGRIFSSELRAQEWLANAAITRNTGATHTKLNKGSLISGARADVSPLYSRAYTPQTSVQNQNLKNSDIESEVSSAKMKMGKSWANRGTAGYKTINTAKGALDGSLPKGYFDFETVGDIGGKNFAITEMALKSGNKMSKQYFQLTNDAASSIRKTIRDLEMGNSVAESALRSAYRMLDYSMDDLGHVVSSHSSLDPTKDWINPNSANGKALIAKMKLGLDIMSGKAGAKGLMTLTNPEIDSWTGHGQSIRKAFEGVFGH